MRVPYKLLIAALVFAAGLVAALAFRRAPLEAPVAQQVSADPVKPYLVGRIVPPAPNSQTERQPATTRDGSSAGSLTEENASNRVAEPHVRPAKPKLNRRSPFRAIPIDESSQPSSVANASIDSDQPSSSAASSVSRPMRPPSAGLPAFEARPAVTARRHRVSDGDTLSELAARFLGDARRADELYTTNLDVLDHPDLLPIGVVLKIPAQRRAVAVTPNK